jgi:hypothetical protein
MVGFSAHKTPWDFGGVFHSYQLSHEKSHGRKNPIGLFFPYGRKYPTSKFDLGVFPTFGLFGRNSLTHCFKWGFSH